MMAHIYIIQTNIKDDSVFLDKVKILGSWVKYFPNSIIVKSELSASELYQQISVGYESSWILISELKANYYGMMPKAIWDWIKETPTA